MSTSPAKSATTAHRNRALPQRLWSLMRSFLHPKVLLHPVRMMHYWGYSHVMPRAEMQLGQRVRIAPNASFRNGANIRLEDEVQIGEYTALWGGRGGGTITVGARTTFGPNCFVTAADYGLAAGQPIVTQPMVERDVVIGADCWIGTKAVITAGVTLGEGCVIGAGSVVTKDIPAGAIAAGIPAKVLKYRS